MMLKSKSKIMEKYGITSPQLERVLWKAFMYYLSEYELLCFIFEAYHSKEHRLNMLSQLNSYPKPKHLNSI